MNFLPALDVRFFHLKPPQSYPSSLSSLCVTVWIMLLSLSLVMIFDASKRL